MRVKEKIITTIRGILEYIYQNPWMFGFEIALLSGILIFLLFERKKSKKDETSSETSENSGDFL